MGSAAKIKIWTHSCTKNRLGTVGPKFPQLWSTLKSYPRSYSKRRKSAFDITDEYNWTFLTFARPWCWAVERRLCNNLDSHQYLWNSELIKSEYKESHFCTMNQLQLQYSNFFSLNEFHGRVGQSHLLPTVLASDRIAAGCCQSAAHCCTSARAAINQQASELLCIASSSQTPEG